jgi:hypothetical protein
MKKILILIFVILVVGFLSWFFYFKNKNLGVACTMDAMACPDGSFVGRIAPKCEFAKCPTGADSKGDELTLGIGESGYINGLNINFETLLQDSRCPNDVTCVWAGAVEVMVKLVDAKNVSKSEEVKMTSIEAPHIFENYEVSISSVVPVKNSKIEIKPKDYLITFKVSKKN